MSKNCAYYLVTDDQGKGQVSKATGQSWESLKNYKGKVNKAIQDAGAAEGETRIALVQLGYSSIRSWCEIFVERELLHGVAERYQPNVRITALPKINAVAISAAVPTVTRIFEEACRHIPGHSHPLVTQGVSPTLESLKAHWAELEECQKTFRSAQNES